MRRVSNVQEIVIGDSPAHAIFFMCALLLGLTFSGARATESEVTVNGTLDIVNALALARSGDTVTFVFDKNVSLDSSLTDTDVSTWRPITVPEGVTAVFTNAPDKTVTVTRAYDMWGMPFQPMVTVKGTLVVQENESGGSLTFDGNSTNFRGRSMFSVLGRMDVKSGTFMNTVADTSGQVSSAGGAISVASGANIYIDGGTFKNCAAKTGGAMSGLRGEAPAITLTLYVNGRPSDYEQPAPNDDGVYTYRDLPVYVGGVAAEYYVMETPIAGYAVSYANPAPYSNTADRAYDGCVITNKKIPRTGDDDFLWAYWTVAVLSLATLIWLGANARRRQRLR